MCLHVYCGIKAGLISISDDSESSNNAPREIDRKKTIDQVINKIIEHFPTFTEDQTDFLCRNKKFVEELIKSRDTDSVLKEHVPNVCTICSLSLVEWKHKTKNSLMISLGEIKKVKITVNVCTHCKVLYYPDLYHVGIVPIHHKFLLSFDYIVELAYLLESGVSLIEMIKSKLLLLSDREKLSYVPDNNVASMIERAAVGVTSLIITGNIS